MLPLASANLDSTPTPTQSKAVPSALSILTAQTARAVRTMSA